MMRIGNQEIPAFVVTVQEMPERTAFIMAHFKERGIEATEFGGINGVLSGLETKHTYDVDNPGTNYHIGPKPTACWVSFWALWSALNLLPDSHFMTLEWDAKFDANWLARTEQALRDVPPDFDMLYLGSCCTQTAPTKHIKGEVYEVLPLCGHATIIAKKALPVILRTQRKIYAPVDLSLGFHTLPLLKTYCILPRVAEQFNTTLTI